MRMLKVESYKKGILLSTGFNFLNKGLLFFITILTAHLFGANIQTDIYFFCYNVIFFISVFFSSLNASVIIPESMRIRHISGERASFAFLNYFLFLYIFLTTILASIIILDPVEIFSVISDFSVQRLKDSKQLLMIAAPVLVLMSITNLLTDILASLKFFTIPMIVGIINGLFAIGIAILFANKIGILSLFIGLILAYLINILFLLRLLIRLGWNFDFNFFKIEKRIWRNIGFAQLGNFISFLTSYLPYYFISGFGNGVVSALTFAQQISNIPTTLVTNQFSTVAGIKFNELLSRGQFLETNKIFNQSLLFLIFVLFPFSALLILNSYTIVTFLFYNSQTPQHIIQQTSIFLKWLALAIPNLAINTFASRLFMATHKISEGFWYQVFFNSLLLILLFFSIKIFGAVGYTIAFFVAHLANILFIYFLLKKYFKFIHYTQVLKYFFIIGLINGGIFLIIQKILFIWGGTASFLQILISGFLYSLLVIGIAFIYKKNNPQSIKMVFP